MGFAMCLLVFARDCGWIPWFDIWALLKGLLCSLRFCFVWLLF